MMLRRGLAIRRRQRHLDDHPVDRGIRIEALYRIDNRGFRRFTLELREARLDADLGATSEDLLEIHGRRRVSADDHDRQARRSAVRLRERLDVFRHSGPDLGRDRPTLEESGRAGRRVDHARPTGSTGSRGSPGDRRRARDARSSIADSSSVTRTVVASSYSGSPVDERLISTLAAAPRACRLPEQGGDIDVTRRVGIDLAGKGFRSRDQVAMHASRQRKGASDAARAAARIACLRASISDSVSRDSFKAAAYPA